MTLDERIAALNPDEAQSELTHLLREVQHFVDTYDDNARICREHNLEFNVTSSLVLAVHALRKWVEDD